ncbi:hypothetical protein GTH32_18080 [Alteromonas sp. 345S023]|uniref:HTH cro/C1-type domain-containing protein n=1 Tax=Alteromonas profundi TaxID=2696062 RepID=A0A7X5LPB2_9ALTE|nr:helix-turn-helix transcriptional regulator [Alteromonas profundi]NDV93080.1 hypothetical protein [Alteromonas profundi]
MAVTKFGKELRILRMERDLILKDMANSLGISSALLSAIELGNRKIPKGLIEKLKSQYDLDEAFVNKLHQLAIESEQSIEFDLNGVDEETTRFLTTFARHYREESGREKVKALMRMLEDD